MKIKDLRKGLQNEMDALVPDVLSKVIAVPINHMLRHGSKEQQLREKLVMRMLFATCCMFFSVLIVTAAFFISNFVKPPTGSSMTYAYMYVAPAVGDGIAAEDSEAFELNFIINVDDTVRFVDAASNSANSIAVLEGLSYHNKNFKIVISEIMQNARTLGWFDMGDSSIVSVSTLNDVEGVAKQIRNEATTSIKNHFKTQARNVDVSVGPATKSGLYLWAHSLYGGVTMDMSINELVSHIETAKHYAE
ncbi:MAG TPA: hypothetical protein VJZ69_01940 [Clostridia bacterium]|nr:hypothetical protein [Clostridia bacterium]